MSETYISALPDIPLLRIFRHLPVNDLLNSIGLVCPGWGALVPKELLHRRSLVLAQDNHESLSSASEYCLQQEFPLLKHIKKNDGSPMVQIQKPNIDKLQYDYVNLENVEHSTLALAMPQITHLTVMCKHVSYETIEKITELLYSNWRDALTSLTVDFDGLSGFKMEETLRWASGLFQLFMAINELGSLKHLKLRLIGFNDPISYEMDSDFELPIVRRLKTLCVQTDLHNPAWFFNSMQFMPNNDADASQPKICFHDCVNIRGFVGLQMSPGHQLTQQFTNISAHSFGMGGYLQYICAGYSSLTTLSLNLEAFELLTMSRHLSRLQHLGTLKLTLTKTYGNPNYNLLELHQGWPILLEYPAPIEEDHQVHSVRLLHLDLATVSHENIAALRIPEIFPNVQVISLFQNSLKCHICKYDFSHISKLSARLKFKSNRWKKDKIDECSRLARQALISCAHDHLHEIHYCPYPFGPANYISIIPQQL